MHRSTGCPYIPRVPFSARQSCRSKLISKTSLFCGQRSFVTSGETTLLPICLFTSAGCQLALFLWATNYTFETWYWTFCGRCTDETVHTDESIWVEGHESLSICIVHHRCWCVIVTVDVSSSLSCSWQQSRAFCIVDSTATKTHTHFIFVTTTMVWQVPWNLNIFITFLELFVTCSQWKCHIWLGC